MENQNVSKPLSQTAEVANTLEKCVTKCNPNFTMPENFIELVKGVEKPCSKLKYCPYALLKSELPMPGSTRQEMIEHNKRLKKVFKKEKLGNKICECNFGDKQNAEAERISHITYMITSFDPDEYPVSMPKEIIDAVCVEDDPEWGEPHLCPVYFISEKVAQLDQFLSKE